MERITQLKQQTDEAFANMDSFYQKNNKAAGTRARKALQNIKQLSQQLRVDIQTKKNNAM